ncbi:MAG: cytochrome bc complex cytochrome b subunit [Nitrospirae bacterium]|nr:MAG: cytochrome bc complex cytochrome b subunit [Nitrospirota bacterium]
MFKALYSWIDERIGLEDLIRRELKEYYVPKESNIWSTLGFLTLIAFFTQAVTGIFLLTYYIPHPDHAFQSVQKIMNTVHFGWLFRSVHLVGANLLVILLLLHVVITFYRLSYKRPREMNWITGVFMFFIIFMFCITGYLLPWSQLSYWSTTILTAIPTVLPGIGDYISRFIKGGEFVGAVTLNRFFAFHVAILPFFLVLLGALHVFLIWRTGYAPISKPVEGAEEKGYHRASYTDGIPFYPDLFRKNMIMVFVFFAVLFGIITFKSDLFLPAYAHIKADPTITPPFIRPPWYFLAPYELIRSIPNKFLGISLQLILLLLFLIWPFVETKPEGNIRKRPILLGFFIAGIIAWVILTILGRF